MALFNVTNTKYNSEEATLVDFKTDITLMRIDTIKFKISELQIDKSKI